MAARTTRRAHQALAVVATVLMLAAPAVGDGPASIIGGTETTSGQYPSVVAIQIDSNLCTGTLVAPSWVITAAHCVDPDGLGYSSQAQLTAAVRVYLHVLDIAEQGSGTIVTASATVKDPLFKKPGSNDIGLIHLTAPVTDITPSPINFAAFKVPVGTVVTVVGYGSTEHGGQGTIGVQFELKDRVSVSCSSSSISVGSDNNLLCFSQTDNKGTCLGDSGGPAFATVDGQRTVVGVTSFGDPQCAEFGADTRSDIEEAFLTTQAPELAQCQRDADCPLHRDCFARKCIAQPFTPTGIGTICNAASDCETAQCAESSQDGKRCSMVCKAHDDSTCPGGFECLPAANGLGVCWPSSGAGCCDAGAANGPAALLLGLGAVALVRRRKRR